MAVLNNFTDRVVEHPGRYTLTDTGGTELGTYDLSRAEGTITEAGTPLNAANMNLVVDAVNEIDERITECVMVERYTLSGMSATVSPGDNTIYIPYDSVPSGFTAVGVVGVGSSGTGSGSLRLRAFGVASGDRAFVKFRSEASADITPTITVDVLWIRSSFVG